MVQGPWGPWDPYLIHLGQGPGPGPLGPGAWGPLGPRYGIRVESVTTYCQASYLLSGKATYCQACTQPLHRLAPNNRIHAPKSFRIGEPHTLHPTTAYLHPRASAYFAPSNGILCTQPLHRLAPKIRIHAPKSFRIHAFNSAYMHSIPHTY